MSRAPKPCQAPGCDRPKMKGKHRCQWHWLAKQSSDVQAAAATARLTKAEGEHRARVPKSEWPAGERWCAGCQSFVPLFYCSGSRCRACTSMAAHEKRLEATYGIDADEYARIFHGVQGGRCAICLNRPASIRFAVDHDHQSGAVRGVLCKRCNHDLLGGSHDSIDLLWRALAYLAFPPAQRVPGYEPTPLEVYEAVRERQRAQESLAAARRPDPTPPPF